MLKTINKYILEKENIRKLSFKDDIFILKFNIFNMSLYKFIVIIIIFLILLLYL